MPYMLVHRRGQPDGSRPAGQGQHRRLWHPGDNTPRLVTAPKTLLLLLSHQRKGLSLLLLLHMLRRCQHKHCISLKTIGLMFKLPIYQQLHMGWRPMEVHSLITCLQLAIELAKIGNVPPWRFDSYVSFKYFPTSHACQHVWVWKR